LPQARPALRKILLYSSPLLFTGLCRWISTPLSPGVCHDPCVFLRFSFMLPERKPDRSRVT
jgi:hypothetical protein